MAPDSSPLAVAGQTAAVHGTECGVSEWCEVGLREKQTDERRPRDGQSQRRLSGAHWPSATVTACLIETARDSPLSAPAARHKATLTDDTLTSAVCTLVAGRRVAQQPPGRSRAS